MNLQSAGHRMFADNAPETYSHEAVDLMQVVETQIRDVVMEYIERGFSHRDIEYVIHEAVSSALLDIRLEIGSQVRAYQKAKDAS